MQTIITVRSAQKMPETPRRPPGRPRSEAARRAILSSALELLERDGYGALSMEALARAAAVSKQTLYRWWPAPAAIVLEALGERAARAAPLPDGGSLAADLRTFMRRTVTGVGGRNAVVLAGLMAQAQLDADFGATFREGFLAGRRAVLRDLLERHRARGTVRHDADLALVVDIAFGTLWYRVLAAHAPLDRRFADALAEVLRALCARPA